MNEVCTNPLHSADPTAICDCTAGS
jgi:hypothetical protein